MNASRKDKGVFNKTRICNVLQWEKLRGFVCLLCCCCWGFFVSLRVQWFEGFFVCERAMHGQGRQIMLSYCLHCHS